MHPLRRSILLLVALATLGPSPARGADFVAGDLYLITTAHPDPEIDTGIMRIVPETGVVTTLGEVPMHPRSIAYDPYRDRFVGKATTPTGGIILVDAAGVVTPLSDTLPKPALVEARGDGILYLYFVTTGNFGYLDASNGFHDLLDESGSGPYSLGNDTDPTALHYDYATNSLLVFGGTDTDIPGCPDQDQSCVLKIPLTADGIRVAASVTTAQVEVSSTWEIVVGTGHAPGGGVLWVLDTNSNNQEPRMQLIEPATMVVTTYAANGAYTGAAATNAGTFSERLGLAVMLDTYHDVLRAFAYGTTGHGTVIAEDVSDPGGSGETASLVEIRPSPFSTGVEEPAPGRCALLPLVPNPFGTLTIIRFDLPAAGRARLEVHDVTGRRVRTLLDADLPPGRHQALWNGVDERGRGVPPGVYLCRLRAGRDASSRAVVRLE